jgi:hypothetical protein
MKESLAVFNQRRDEILKAADELGARLAGVPSQNESEWIYLDIDYSRPPTNLINRQTRQSIDQHFEFRVLMLVTTATLYRAQVAAGKTALELKDAARQDAADCDKNRAFTEEREEYYQQRKRLTEAEFERKMGAAMQE